MSNESKNPEQPEGFTHFPELLESVQQMDAMLKAEGAQGERESFKLHFKHLDFSEDLDAWGRPRFIHPDVEALWSGWQARAAMAQRSPAPEGFRGISGCLIDAAKNGHLDGWGISREEWYAAARLLDGKQPSPALEQYQDWEVEQVAFVLRNIGALEAEDIDGDNVDLRFEDANGRNTGCDVSIVEYAEKAANLLEQHDRIVEALRADRDASVDTLCKTLAAVIEERDAALAKLAAMEQQEPVAHLRASDLERLRKPGVAGCGAALENEPRDGFVPIYLAPVAQAGQVPDVSAMARALSDRQADACNVDRDDQWKLYGNDFIEDVKAMLAAAPAQGGE